MMQLTFPYNNQAYIDPLNYNVPVYGNDPTSDFQQMENFAPLPHSINPMNAVLPTATENVGSWLMLISVVGVIGFVIKKIS